MANNAITEKEFYKNYLSILLKSPLTDDHSAQLIIDKYNEVYLKNLKNTTFVVNDKNEVVQLSEIIIDKSGISEIFGNDFLYELSGTSKRLPHKEIDSKYLEYEYAQCFLDRLSLDLYSGNDDQISVSTVQECSAKIIRLRRS